MSNLDLNAFDEGPFAQELIQIELGLKSWPEPDAKRHHFIPRFLLNRFAKDNERLVQLDKTTGKPQVIGAKSAASRYHFYTFADDEGQKSSVVEGILGMVENHAAPALKRLEETGEVTDVDRATIAMFLAYLWSRTPATRERAEKLAQDTAAGLMASKVNDRNAFMDLLREQAEEDEEMRRTPEEAEELRRHTLKMLKDGSLSLTDPDGGATTNLLMEVAHDTAVLVFAAMEWTLVRASGAEFVTSDRGAASFDPTPQHPWSSHTIYSSPNAETFFPISAECCLLVSPGEPGLQTYAAKQSKVMEINLRVYGRADRYIYGRTQDAVTAVRRALKKRPRLAAAPLPHRQVKVIECDPEDDRLAEAHIARGWEPYMIEQDENGLPRQLDYMVIGEEGDAVEIALNGDDLVRRRAMKAAGLDPDSDVDFPGEIATKPMHPGAIKPTLWG
jgi:Protein of unknown function (DUF4238)